MADEDDAPVVEAPADEAGRSSAARLGERGMEASRRRREEHLSKVISGEPIRNRELRLARLYGVNTTAPLVQTRTKTEVEPPVRAIDLPPPSPTTTAMNKSFFTMVNPDPWKPAGPALKLLGRPTLAPEDRPHDPYIEPWYGSPLLWEKECEYVSGSKLSGGVIVPYRPSHHGLTAFEKLHRDDPKRRFQRGLSKLKALARLSTLSATFTIRKAINKPPRTQEEKRADVDAMIELMARKGFAADGSRLPGWVKSDAPAPPPAAEAGVSAGVAGKLLGLFDKKKAEAASPAEEEEKARPGRSTLARAALGVGLKQDSLSPSVSPVKAKKYAYEPSDSLLQSIRSTKLSKIGSRDLSMSSTLSSVGSMSSMGSLASTSLGRPSTSSASLRPGKPLYQTHPLSGASPHPLDVDVSLRKDIGITNPRHMPRLEMGHHTKAFAVRVTDGAARETATASSTEQRKLLREQLRWKELRTLMTWMSTGPDHLPGLQDLELLELELKTSAAESGTPNRVTRDQFWSIVSLRGLPYGNANRLFSAYDVEHAGSIDYRFLLASLRALRRPHEEPIAKMIAMFRYFINPEDPGSSVSRSDVVACLSLACTTDEQRQELSQLTLDALQYRLGMKSIWAKDVTLASFQTVMSFTPVLVDRFATHLKSSLKA